MVKLDKTDVKSRMKTNGDIWREHAKQIGIPLVSIWNAQEALARAKKTKADGALARIMLHHGRLTSEAREYVAREYPQD